MKKVIIIVVIILIGILAALGTWLYIDEQENKKLDAESVTLKEKLTIEFGKKAKVSDFLANLNGSLVDDYEIDTEKLGEIQVDFEYINIKNKKRKYEYKIQVIDVNKPQIFSGATYSVKQRL